jgi:methionyl-tRNA synthetase
MGDTNTRQLQTNRYLTNREPWKEHDPTRRGRALALGRESLRICGILLQPFLPTRIPLLLDWLGVPGEQRGLVWASFGAVPSIGGLPATPEQKLYNTIK